MADRFPEKSLQNGIWESEITYAGVQSPGPKTHPDHFANKRSATHWLIDLVLVNQCPHRLRLRLTLNQAVELRKQLDDAFDQKLRELTK
jgi:hypothetical protein